MAVDDGLEEPFGAEIVREMHQSRLDSARSQYEAGINRLWAGCGGGMIGVVTALRHPLDPSFRLSVGAFGLGIFLLGIGALWTLISARTIITHLENIEGIMQVRTDYVERPSVQAGLSLSHPQTLTALAAAGFFVLGVIFAGILVFQH